MPGKIDAQCSFELGRRGTARTIALAKTLRRNISSTRSDFPMTSSSDEILNYTGPIAFGVGIIHGLGAETPSQLALFLLAANLRGVAKGIGGMAMLLVGLLVMNTIMTGSASGMFRSAAPHLRTMRFFVGLTAVYSFVIDCIFLLGSSGYLPSLN